MSGLRYCIGCGRRRLYEEAATFYVDPIADRADPSRPLADELVGIEARLKVLYSPTPVEVTDVPPDREGDGGGRDDDEEEDEDEEEKKRL